nr:MAG TPA: hypothetical protein [Caudoviricetes sp.]
MNHFLYIFYIFFIKFIFFTFPSSKRRSRYKVAIPVFIFLHIAPFRTAAASWKILQQPSRGYVYGCSLVHYKRLIYLISSLLP